MHYAASNICVFMLSNFYHIANPKLLMPEENRSFLKTISKLPNFSGVVAV